MTLDRLSRSASSMIWKPQADQGGSFQSTGHWHLAFIVLLYGAALMALSGVDGIERLKFQEEYWPKLVR